MKTAENTENIGRDKTVETNTTIIGSTIYGDVVSKAKSDQNIKENYLTVPIEVSNSEFIGIKLGRVLDKKIGLKTFRDLLLKILLPDLIFAVTTYGTYSLIPNVWIAAIPFIPFLLFLFVFITALPSRCKKCNKFFGVVLTDRKLVKSENFQNYIISNYLDTYECDYCKNKEIIPVAEKEEKK